MVLGAFLDTAVQAFSAQRDLIHADSHCGREGCWLMKQPVGSGTAEVVNVPSSFPCPVPGITASRARTSGLSSKLSERCRCVAHYVRAVQTSLWLTFPPLGSKLRWFLEPLYFWPRDPYVRGSCLWESSRAGRGGGSCRSHLIFICICDSTLSLTTRVSSLWVKSIGVGP